LAENAPERAAGLRRDADAPARPVERDAHRLEDVASRAEQILHERVDGAPAPVQDREARGAAPRQEGEGGPLRETTHAVEIVAVLGDETRDDPVRETGIEAEVRPGGQERLRCVV